MLRSRVLFFALSTGTLLGCTAVLGSFTVDPNADGADAGGSSSGGSSSGGSSSGSTSSSGDTSSSSGGSSSGGSSSGGSSSGGSSSGGSDGGPEGGSTVTYGVTVSKDGSGAGAGLVSSPKNEINCGSTCVAQFPAGTSLTLTASVSPPSIFKGWSGACAAAGAATQCQVTVDKTLAVGASFQGPYKLTLQNAGTGKGKVTSTPAGIDCTGQTTCTGQFGPGAKVTLTAQPAPGYVFMGWKGACSGPKPTCDVTLDGDKGVEADFGTPATWDPNWSPAGSVAFSNGNMTISGNTPNTKNARTNFGRTKGQGRFYWEIKVVNGNKATDDGGLGIMEGAFPNANSYIGSALVPSGFSFGYGGFQQYWTYWVGTTVTGTLPPTSSYVNAGNVYMFALDVDAGNLWCGQDGAWYNGDPATGTNPTISGLSGVIYPGVTFYASSPDVYTANFGSTPMQYGPPPGFPPGFFQ